ncbi:MFS transporter, PCFT/HCP family, solute carrier family 46 (folate transporter), member 1/3 [Mytilus galloprovincialis]|uniref:MFS transporter, PCFT/HCP family, solute carrier family 46 (Folate transporter), member 1/3 n=1 Tax=Mytilus galloprovincialis TaxID=29158 RepID=A0A8B6DX63_MYTGA|nr:MFS transporter, PCFT/HCP family, solute carrier family 46 (folate transporter), member 1/3 [Mytilus galloprovincialis]
MDTIEEPLLPVPDVATEKPVVVRPMYQFITLEIIGILHFGALMAMSPIQQFYVIDEIAKKYGEEGEKSNVDYCPKGPVFSNSTSNIVQAESANILMYLGFIGTFIAVIPILVFGSLTDRYGRKFPLYLSMVGILLKEIVMTVTVYKGLSLWFLALGDFFLGITGHFGLFLAAMMGMIADITTPGKDRAIQIIILEGTVAIAVAFSILGIGFWIKDGNYRHPLIMCIACTVLSLILTLTFLSETAKTNKKKNNRICTKSVMGACFDVYRNGNRNRNKKMLIGQILFCINVGALMGNSNVVTLFLLHKPLCWSELHVQVFTCFQLLVNWGSILLGIRILHKYLSDYTIIIAGTVSAIASSVTLAFSSEDGIVYLYAVIGIMAVSISPLLRSVLSRLVSPDEQGSLFACIGSSELLLTSLGQLFYGFIYKESVSYLPGLVFLITAGILVIEFCLSLVLYSVMSSEPVSVTETVIQVS